MCGIAGTVSLGATARRAASRDIVESQLATMRHRGPDATGLFAGAGGAVGQNRLAIIDLRTGDPPVTDESGDIGVVLNGEIYNYEALRKGLCEQGHILSTSGDTETIAHLAERLSPSDLARRLHGMFAFAVWDRRRRRLVLGRDRLGKKPLYYTVTTAGDVVFGSEIKSVLAHPGVQRRPADGVIGAYLTFGYVPTPDTFFQDIKSVRPGHVLVAEPGQPVREERYWEYPLYDRDDPRRLDVSIDEAAALVLDELDEAVERRLVADVPLGAFLSGGIDSSLVVALMARHTENKVRTFTIGFDDQDGFDERRPARLVADHVGTEHTEFVVAPDAVDLIEGLVWHYDQPFGDSSALPTHILSKLTRQDVTVALCGDGGDELFGGYERFGAALALDRFQLLPPSARSAVTAGARTISGAHSLAAKVHRFATDASRPLPEALLAWLRIAKDRDMAALAPHADAGAVADYLAIWSASSGAPTVDRILDLNLRTYLLDDLLPKVDRMSMANSLEVRAPLLDTDLLDLAARLPAATKIGHFTLKRVLRRAARGLLPPEILRRGKRGFGVPVGRWFREDLAQFVEARLGAPTASVRRHVNPDGLDALLRDHAGGQRDCGQLLWELLTLELFLEREGW